MRLAFPYELETGEDGRLFITVPDVPAAGGAGWTEAEACGDAAASLAAALAAEAARGRPLPVPAAPHPGQRTLEVEAPDAEGGESGRG